MDALLNTLLEITVYVGLLFFVILIFKRVFHKHISASLNYMVWILLVVRLLMPVTIDSSIRLFVIPEETEPVIQTETETDSEVNLSIAESPEGADYASQSQPMQNAVSPSIDTGSFETNTLVQTVSAVHIDWETAVVLVWISGMIGYLVYIAFMHMRFRRVIRRSNAYVPADVLAMVDACKKELGIKVDIRVLLQSNLTTPAMTLSFRPVLLLPVSMLGAMSHAQVELGIRHELSHYKRKDHLMRLLLLLLRGVYWFNPVVWIAYRMMLADMETACDAHVTACLGKQQKDLYIHTIIDLGSDRYARCALGMGTARGKKNMERRIRGMFMKKKSRRSAQAAALLLVPVILIMCFTTACQPTPEEAIIVPKGDDLSDIITSASDDITEDMGDSTLYTQLSAPQHWNLETTALNEKLNISADVDIELPDVSALPAATAVLRAFTQDEIKNIVSVVLGDGLTFTETARYTKESLEQQIIEIQQNISAQETGEIFFDAEGIPYNASGEVYSGAFYDESDLERYQSLYNDAPYESELKKKDLTIETISSYEDYQGVSVNTVVDDQGYTICAGSAVLPDAVYNIKITSGISDYTALFGGTYLDEPYGVSMSKEEAAEQAQAVATQLTDELKLCYVVPTVTNKQETERNWGWACVFMREINGCPTAYESKDVGSSMESMEMQPIRYEKMTIVIDDLGVTSFEWENPMTITSIDSENVAVMSFDEIEPIAIDQLANYHQNAVLDTGDNHPDPGATVYVTKVELGLMRVMKANSNEYYYIPVWNFFSDFEHTDAYIEEVYTSKGYTYGPPTLSDCVDENGNPNILTSSYPQAWGAVTINAIDGSIIDRDLGY